MTEENTDKGSALCPCCGQPLKDGAPKPPDAKMALWMSAMLSGTPYTDTYPLYGGAVRVTASVTGPQRSRALARALTRLRTLRDRAIDRTDDPICLDFVERYDDLEAALRTLAFIREVTVDGDGDSRVYDVAGVVWPIVETIASTPVPDKDELAATLKTTMSALEDLERPELVSGLPANAMVSVASVHQQIASLLSDAGMDENFWRGIRLG